jgi:hypothetical protein
MLRRIGVLLGAVLITAAIYGVAYLRHEDSENWKRLEAQALRFEPPTITIVYRTTAAVRAGCDQILVAVAAQVGRAKSDALATGCGRQAHAPLGGTNAPSRTHKIPPTGNGTLVWVQFNADSD